MILTRKKNNKNSSLLISFLQNVYCLCFFLFFVIYLKSLYNFVLIVYGYGSFPRKIGKKN